MERVGTPLSGLWGLGFKEPTIHAQPVSLWRLQPAYRRFVHNFPVARDTPPKAVPPQLAPFDGSIIGGALFVPAEGRRCAFAGRSAASDRSGLVALSAVIASWGPLEPPLLAQTEG